MLIFLIPFSKGNTQNSKNLSDSLMMNRADLEKVLRSAERGWVYKEEVESKNKLISILEDRLEIKDSIIYNLKESVKVHSEIASLFESNYKIEQVKYNDLYQSFENYKKLKEREIKKLKFQKTTKIIGGSITGVIAGILVKQYLIK